MRGPLHGNNTYDVLDFMGSFQFDFANLHSTI